MATAALPQERQAGGVMEDLSARLPMVECPTPRCNAILCQRPAGWRGDPLWIKCRKCGKYVRVAHDSVRIVSAPGADR